MLGKSIYKEDINDTVNRIKNVVFWNKNIS